MEAKFGPIIGMDRRLNFINIATARVHIATARVHVANALGKVRCRVRARVVRVRVPCPEPWPSANRKAQNPNFR